MLGLNYFIDEDGRQRMYPWEYKKALLGFVPLFKGEGTVVYIEGVETSQINDSIKANMFNIAGYPIWTNSGQYLTKKQLQMIINIMPEKANLCFAGLSARVTIESIQDQFEKDNNMVQIGPNSFKPKEV